ncbi:MAG: hypothetical protein D6820_14990, partial [Lentisphaerae bacterium]
PKNITPTDVLDFRNHIFKNSKRKEYIYVFGIADIYATEDTTCSLHIAHDDALTIWMWGRRIYFDNEYLPMDKMRTLDISLRKGVNRFVFRCVNYQIDWFVHIRLTQKGNMYPPKNAGFVPVDILKVNKEGR